MNSNLLLATSVRNVLMNHRTCAAGKRPAVYLPEDVIRAVDAKIGDEVEIYVEGNKIIIEKSV